MSEEVIRLSDGTTVPREEEGTWTDGKSVVIFADTAVAEIEIIDTSDPRAQVFLDDQGNVVEPPTEAS